LFSAHHGNVVNGPGQAVSATAGQFEPALVK
jgi:hypothetical protein